MRYFEGFDETVVIPNEKTHMNGKTDFFCQPCLFRRTLSQLGRRFQLSHNLVTMSKGGEYEAIYKELDKLDVLYGVPGKLRGASLKTKTKSIETSLDTLLASLHEAKRQVVTGEKPPSDVASLITTAVEVSKKEIEDRQKEIYNSLNRLGKALDKVCRPTPPRPVLHTMKLTRLEY